MRIVVVDDHDLVRVGVRDYLSSLPGYEVVGEASSAREAFKTIAAERPEVVLMDIALPGMDGVVATREILRRSPRARIIILSGYKQIQDVVDALEAGAVGFVLKGDPPETLTQALERTARGAIYVAPSLAPLIADFETRKSTRGVLGALTEREREIFRLAADCRTASEIARELCLARKTVDTHLNRVHRKLGLHDRAALVRLAAGLGLVHSIRRPIPGASDGAGA